MNLSNKIKSLENRFNVNSEVCTCGNGFGKVVLSKRSIHYDAYETGGYVPYQDSETARREDEARAAQNPTEPQTRACERCGKQAEIRYIHLVSVITPGERTANR